MIEANEPKKTALARASQDTMVVDTTGGRVHVRRDETAQGTPYGQIVFFAEFLATAGVFDRWVQDCPLHCNSPTYRAARRAGHADAGHTGRQQALRAHFRRSRRRGVGRALGLRGMVSEDSVRRALAAMVEFMQPHIDGQPRGIEFCERYVS